jgi:hypothetical protein
MEKEKNEQEAGYWGNKVKQACNKVTINDTQAYVESKTCSYHPP